MEQDREELEFCEEWLSLQKYNFKILTLVTVLADNQRAFRGKLSAFCDNLGIQSSSANIKRIKESLEFLAENDFIKVIVDKNIYTITLSKMAEKSKNVIKIKRTWYKLIRDNQNTSSWESTLKVFLVLIELSSMDVVTYNDIAEKIGMKKRTVQTCVEVLTSIDFEDFRITKEIHTRKNADGSYITDGQSFEKGIFFE